MPPKTKMTAEEVQAEIDNDPEALIRNDLSVKRKVSRNSGINKDIALSTFSPKGRHKKADEDGPVR